MEFLLVGKNTVASLRCCYRLSRHRLEALHDVAHFRNAQLVVVTNRVTELVFQLRLF